MVTSCKCTHESELISSLLDGSTSFSLPLEWSVEGSTLVIQAHAFRQTSVLIRSVHFDLSSVPFQTQSRTSNIFSVSFRIVASLHCISSITCRHNNPALGFETPYRQLHWAYLIFYNLQLLFLPSGLMAEYPMGTIPPISSLLDYRNIVTLATFATLFFFSWKSVTCCDLYTRKPLVFGLALMIFPFLPASNLFFPVGFVVAERVLYIPSMGFCILVALGFWKLKQSCPFIVKVGIAYLLVVHSTKTCVRNRDWYSSIDLFQSAVTVAPNNGKMFNNLASQIDLAGNKTLAVQLFRQSIRVEPYFITAYGNLAYCLRGLGNMSEATKVS